MSSKIEVKHTVELRYVYCVNNALLREKREYKTSNCKYSKQENQQTFLSLSKMAATLDSDSLKNISYVQKKYEQVSCYINDKLSSVLIDLDDESSYLLYSELLEKVEQENAKSVFYSDGENMMLHYLTYGYEYRIGDDLHERDGFLNSYERDVEGFRETCCMFGRFMGNLEMNLEGLEEGRKQIRSKMKNV